MFVYCRSGKLGVLMFCGFIKPCCATSILYNDQTNLDMADLDNNENDIWLRPAITEGTDSIRENAK